MINTIKILLEEIIPNPSVVLDEKGNLLYANTNSKGFNFNCAAGNNFINTITISGKKELSELVAMATESNQPQEKTIELNFESKISMWNVKVSPLMLDNQNFVLVNFFESKDNNETSALTLAFNESEIKKYLEQDYIVSVLSKLKSSFPFTFIGRQRFLHDIDALEQVVWVRDSKGMFVLANRKFLSLHNLKLSQIQNKTTKDLFVSSDSEIFNVVDRYLMKTRKSIAFTLNIHAEKEEQMKFIQIPLMDIDKNIVAIVGISVKDEIQIAQEIEKVIDYGKIAPLTEEYSFVINTENKLENYSKAFSELLKQVYSSEFDEAYNEFEKDYASKGINLLINSFQEKFVKENVINIENYTYDLHLSKIVNENELIGYFGFLKEKAKLNQQKNENEKMYDLIIHSIPQPMYIYDAENLKFLDVNQAALKMYGYLREEFLELDLTDLYTPEDIQTLIETSSDRNVTSDFIGPCRHKHKNGNIFLVEISKTLIEFAGKKAYFNIIKDITKQTANETLLKQYSFAFRNSEDLLISTDRDGFINEASDSALSYFQFSKSDFGSKSFLSLIGDEDRAKINAEIFHSNVKDVITIKSKLRKPNETNAIGEIIAQPVVGFDRQTESFIIIIRPEKKQEVIVQKVQETQAASGLDASFLSNLFHELLTPINVMIGFIQDITENIEHPTKEQQESIDIIKENQQMLMQIIDNAVEFSNIEQNKIELSAEKILFIDLLEGIEESIRKIARNKRVDFNYGKISSSLKFSSDKQRISTLISLLTRFGIQVTKKDKIYLSAYQKDDEKWIVSVRDDRNNISDDLLKNMQRILTDDENDLKHTFGISRFTIRLFRKLIILLGGIPEIPKKYGEALEFGLVFPYEISFEEIRKTEEEIELAEPVQPEEKPVEVKQEVIQQQTIIEEKKTEVVQPAQLSVADENKVDEKIAEQPQAVFKQVEKIVSSIQEKEKTEEPKPVEKVEIKEPEKPKLALNELSCLYLEDQIDSQILFKVQMKDLKLIDFAPSFEKAIPLLQANKYDFIVMDINLQGEYNGLDALRAIQKMKGFEKMPVIAVTAYVLPGDRDRFIRAGFSNFITKPILKDKMENILKQIF
jgi:PAS domain S-box-containing protein